MDKIKNEIKAISEKMAIPEQLIIQAITNAQYFYNSSNAGTFPPMQPKI